MEARAQLGIARSTLYPQVQQAIGDALWAGEERSKGKDISALSFRAGLGIGWEIDFGASSGAASRPRMPAICQHRPVR
jgi:outer membrane protein TolC